ncbi:titin-like [Anopheles stephensi]|uniref:titin-like n=1 Tax=Anopheles stephensi TaxID=30069 RepID=UPI001658C0D9|nr:titin-like [Anopheles stephensi]
MQRRVKLSERVNWKRVCEERGEGFFGRLESYDSSKDDGERKRASSGTIKASRCRRINHHPTDDRCTEQLISYIFGKANMKAFIVFSMALALASAAAVDDSKKEKRGLYDLESAHESYESYDHHHQPLNYGYTKKEIITKKVPVPYPVEVEKHVPVPVKVPYPVKVEKEVPFVVEKKVPVYIEKKVPVHVDRPYPVEVKVPVEVPVYKKEYVEVPKPYAVHVEKPYPVYVKQPVYVEKQVPVTVHIKEHHKKPFWG